LSLFNHAGAGTPQTVTGNFISKMQFFFTVTYKIENSFRKEKCTNISFLAIICDLDEIKAKLYLSVLVKYHFIKFIFFPEIPSIASICKIVKVSVLTNPYFVFYCQQTGT
jgi:hypothetical protein